MSVQEEVMNRLLQKVIDYNLETILEEPPPNDDNDWYTTKKSTYMSNQARQMGNSSFEKNDFSMALYHFTHSICFAEDQSLELALAFANRSAVLYEQGYFKECLEDIQRAFDANYPDEKKQKLLDRQKRAIKNLNQQILKPFHDPVPVISNPSADNSCISDGLQKQKNSEFGRFIVATRDIEPGEILLVEDPYCQNTIGESSWIYCSECLELCFNTIPCNGCSVLRYCSEECREKAYSEYHKYECVLIQTNEDSFLTTSLFIRTTFKCFLERKTRDTKNFSKKYKKIQKLLTHKSEKSPEDLKAIEESVDKVYHLLATKTGFLDQIDLKDKESFLKKSLLHNYLVCDVNVIKITTYQAHPPEAVPFGSGIYAYFSMFNHACSYNVGYSFYGKKIVLRAWRKISRGEQCFVNYGCISYKNRKQDRQSHLRKSFHFTCKCKACEENWPTEESLVGLPKTPRRYEMFAKLRAICETIRSGDPISEKKRKEMINVSFKISEKLRQFEPCFEFVLIGYIYDSLLMGGNQQLSF